MDATIIPETATLARDVAQTAMDCSGVVGLDEENIATFGVGPPVRGVRVITDEDARVNISIDILVEEGPNIADVAERVRNAIFDHGAQLSLRIGRVDVRVSDVRVSDVRAAAKPSAARAPTPSAPTYSDPAALSTPKSSPPTPSVGEREETEAASTEFVLGPGGSLRITIDVRVQEHAP